MTSGSNPSETSQVRRAMMARMATISFRHLKGIDLRTGAVLMKHGLLDKFSFRVEDEMIQALQTGEGTVEKNRGPAIFWKQRDEVANVKVSDLWVLLLSPQRKIRRSALDYLKDMNESAEEVWSSKTGKMIVECASKIMSKNPKEWRAASVAVVDAINNDFLFNLCGLRQSLKAGFDEGVRIYLYRVLRPSVASVESIQLRFSNPSQIQSEIESAISKYASESQSLHEACDSYFQELGHLALEESLSLGRVVDEWCLATKNPCEVWNELWSWADSTKSALARYHVCFFLCGRPEIIPQEDKPQFWSEVLRIIRPVKEEAVSFVPSVSWGIRAHLARHYLQYLECLFPGGDGERSAVLASWMSEKIAIVLDEFPKVITQYRESLIIPLRQQVYWQWGAARSPVKPSLFRYLTILSGSTSWSLALLGKINRNADLIDAGSIPEELRKLVVDCISINTLGWFVPTTSADHRPTYAFESKYLPTVDTFLKITTDPPTQGLLKEALEANLKISDPKFFHEMLRRICSEREEAQALIAFSYRALVFSGDQSAKESGSQLILDPSWREEVFTKCSLGAMEALFDGILEAAISEGGEVLYQIPHFFAFGFEQGIGDEKRQELLFVLTLLSSIGTETSSAIRRLLTGSHRSKIIPFVKDWRGRLEEIQKSGTPWVAARLRPILAVLQVT